MEFAVLGPLEIRHGEALVEIGSRKQRALLIHLLLHAGKTVPVDRLIDALWAEDPPPQARITLRSYISNLRRVLHAQADEDLIVTRSNGYSLEVIPGALDSVRFEQGVATARSLLRSGDPQGALAALDDALRLWRGQALADLGDGEAASGERARLEELRLSAHEDRFEALLAVGAHAEAVASLEAFTAAEPLRERARGQLMIGLYRSGRAADALQVFQRFRTTLVEELGLDPGPQLQQLADQILNQAAELDAPATPSTPTLASAADVTAEEEAPAPSQSAGALVGRVHERAELVAALSRLSHGEGGLLLLAGEPGIGKTALLEELARLAAEAGVLAFWGRASETQGAPAFWPWTQILRAMARAHDDTQLRSFAAGDGSAVGLLVEEIARRTGSSRPVVGDDLEGARFELYDGIATFLLRAAEHRPLVLLVDDLHWADVASLQALAFIAPLLGSGRILVVGSYRDIKADFGADLEATLATVIREPSTRQLGLSGLQPLNVGQLAQRVSGEAPSARLLELLHGRTGGNPFFVRQLSHLLTESTDTTAAVAIPAGVRHVLARRLTLVSPPARELLEVASVVGRSFDVRRLSDVTDSRLDVNLDAAEEATAHGLLEAEEGGTTRFRFVHALVRETIYDGLAPHRRARLHALIAEALEALPQSSPAELADHFWNAADVIDDGRPVRYLIAAADQAMDLLGYEQAEQMLRRALQVLVERRKDPVSEVQVRAKLVQLLIATGGWASPDIEEVAGSVRGLIRQVGLRPEIVTLWSSLLDFHLSRGDLGLTEAVVEEMLEEGESAGDSAVLAAGYSALAYLDVFLGHDPRAALEHVARAQEHADATPPEQLRSPPHIGVQITNLEAMALAMLGDGAGATAAAQRAINAADEIGDPFRRVQTLTTAGVVATTLEDPELAADAAAAGLVLCRQHAFRMAALPLTATNSWARARMGEDPAEHADRMRDVMAATAASGQGHGPRGRYLLYTAETYLLAGDAAAASQCLQQARVHVAELGEQLPAERLARVEAGIKDLMSAG